jgi:hypothetical protein
MPCDRAKLAETIVTDKSLCELTMFSAYFAYRALAKAERYELSPQLLEPWPRMLEWGLTTCPEFPNYAKTRSDCHAWSAGPLVEFCREILGVQPASPGFAKVRIAPRPAGLNFARGRVALPGERFVDVDWRIEGGVFRLTAEAPVGVPCEVRLPGGTVQEFSSGGAIRVESRR